jgi:hemerythrin-like domain-containing protein
MTSITAALLNDDDMEIMRILHNAFRRDGARLAQAADTYSTADPETHDALLLGWHGFSSGLHHHHTIEDTHIWPLLRQKLADQPDDLAVLDDMESEHARIDPTLAALEEAFDDPDSGPAVVAERISDVVELLKSHLAHEERDAFALIRRHITSREWAVLNKSSMKELSYSDIAQLGPYLLDGAPPDEVRRVLSELPAPLRLVHRFWWNPRYQRDRRWQ